MRTEIGYTVGVSRVSARYASPCQSLELLVTTDHYVAPPQKKASQRDWRDDEDESDQTRNCHHQPSEY